MQRNELLDRFWQLRPLVLARMRAAVPEALRTELGAVTAHQLQALTRLGTAGKTMGELASALDVSGPAACMLADRLVVRGLAERRSDPRDRRRVRVVPTAKGERLAERYELAQRRAFDALFEQLSDDQLATWVEIIACLAEEDRAAGAASVELAAEGSR